VNAIDEPLRHALTQSAAVMGVSLTDAQTTALLAYMALIQKWNKVYNLTAVRDAPAMLTHHLLDSLAVIAPLQAQLQAMPAVDDGAARRLRLLDVGSGAGLPGVVIAIMCPEIQVDCVDTVAKKSSFIQQVAVTLRLPNLRGVHARVESLTDKYQVVSSRAFASLVDFTNWSVNVLAEQGVWMGMKGKHPADEIGALPSTVAVFHVEQLDVPGLGAERCIVWMRPSVAS
jgi:16S rRNA (guanine527-N7)-methyltransferase